MRSTFAIALYSVSVPVARVGGDSGAQSNLSIIRGGPNRGIVLIIMKSISL